MRFNYKVLPVHSPHPAFPSDTSTWVPVLPVQLSHGHGKKTARFEAIIDSGAAHCLFHADIGQSMGINIDKGPKASTSGIAKGIHVDAYFHDVTLWVVADMIRIRVGFVRDLPVAGLLGRKGFFENFIVTFDPSSSPPGFELQRVGHA